MKTITIKRRRRMTKHRKGMTKPRKSNRRIKNRKHKTRRQSGGWGWESFIKAQDNPRSGVEGKGIDVKVEVNESNTPVRWLIGGDRFFDATFGELKGGAKDGRYTEFIAALENDNAAQNPQLLLNFTDPGRADESSKGIWLSHDQFCRLFINGSNSLLHYPELSKRFNQRQYTCSGTSGPSASSSASAAPSAAPPPVTVTTKFFKKFNQINEMQLNVTPQQIARTLNDTSGDVNLAVAILLSAAADQIPGARGGPSAAFRAPPPGPSAAQQYATPPPPPSSAPAQHVQRPSPSEQTIQNLMDGRFTRKVVMSALNQTNNNVAAAIDLLNLPPTQVVQEAYPVTSDLKNPDTFVKNYVRTKHIELLPQPVYASDQMRNLNAFPGFDRWKVIQTVGDGNCLTHAFLQCLSPTYGKIKDDGGYKNKYNVALEFRKVFSQTSDLARDKNTYSDGNYTRYLTDHEITDYSRLFNLITVVFENQFGQTLINASNFSRNSHATDNVLFIHGDGSHYSSVMRPTEQFTMTLAEARQIPGLRQSLTI